MKAIILATICLFSITCFAQTKLISFRSHSGNIGNFRTAVEGNLFDMGNSNFGTGTDYRYEIDKVILKSNKEIIIKRKTFSRHWPGKPEYETANFTDTLTEINAPAVFKANNIDSLKAEIHRIKGAYSSVKYVPYQIINLDSTQFIGFDKQFKQKKASPKK